MIILGEMNGFRPHVHSGCRFTLYILGGNEWVRFPRHSVSGSTLLGLTWDSWCGKGTAPGCAWCLRGAMLLRGFRLFGVALHREPKGTKRPSDAVAVLEWGLNTPFSSQDKPPLAIAMVVTVNGVRSLKRFRLVIA